MTCNYGIKLFEYIFNGVVFVLGDAYLHFLHKICVQNRKDLVIVITVVIMTAHTSIDVHMCGALCMQSNTENPLNDFRFDVTLADMRGNLDWSDACWCSDHCSMSRTSQVLSFIRMHLPPCLSIWHRLWVNVETWSDDIVER